MGNSNSKRLRAESLANLAVCKTREQTYKDIHGNMALMKVESLYVSFMQIDKHPMIIIFDKKPKFDDDKLVRIDLIYKFDKLNCKKKLNVVRFQSKTFGDFRNNETCLYNFDNNNCYYLMKSLKEVYQWCIDYQENNKKYAATWNNCRTFMIKLCKYIGIVFPEKMPCEEYLYKTVGYTNKCCID